MNKKTEKLIDKILIAVLVVCGVVAAGMVVWHQYTFGCLPKYQRVCDLEKKLDNQ